MLSYSGCHVRAIDGWYIGCIGTHAHGRQVTSLLCQFVTSSCNNASPHIQGHLEACFKVNSQW